MPVKNKIGKAIYSFFILISTCFFSCTEAATYYISATGDDNNNGTSPTTPWKTIPELAPGNNYLLKKGEVFYFNINAISNPDEADKITISSYGEGAKPVISLYRRIKPVAWVKQAANIWKADLTNQDFFTGFAAVDTNLGLRTKLKNYITGTTPYLTNIGFIKVNNVIHGNKVVKRHMLAAPWDFYSDDKYLYIYLHDNPGKDNATIEISCNVNAISASDNMTITDLAITGAGAHGIFAENKKNIVIDQVDITEIGGSFLPDFDGGTTRFGNGIEFWNGSSNCVVRNCTVSQVYDVAFTLQGTSGNTHFNQTTFENNLADSNEQSFEAWVKGGGPGFTGCKFINNLCLNAGYSWSHAVRPADNQNTAVHILLFDWQGAEQDLLIQGNTFYRAKSGLYYASEEDIPAFESKNNKVYLDAGVPVRSGYNTYKIENANRFVTAFGKESNSVFKLVNTITPAEILKSFKVDVKKD